ncbi:NTE family protein [Rhodothalassium salexigens DSM 2132]|uniref:NTE family protein n=1 Tax=Rhodothalassium salexigens DSM 2132 TaxID=1188247 RepID=A0A4R2PRE8_RHOSA|nr:patatin-like phospholipase family protein [Rhodothalassium salexigens]MBB4210143.1 NTE family protein [Rhodothalassium salexigens DSM 2132]MBK1640119.1 hypothetical protein [Rhodothalassium salexigens DSM 2132]TCP38307.1 NTE family protein [Rhodothalassium salexigens DSM 2132]
MTGSSPPKPRVEITEDPGERRGKLGLALGAGGALGWAHIGVIRTLMKAGILPDIVTGCSMGAVVGACYADDRMDHLEEVAAGLGLFDMMRLIDIRFGKGGFLGGDRIREMIDEPFRGKTMDRLKRPFAVVASDLCTGDCVVLDRGPVAEAVRASIAVPGVFRPVVRGDQILVDGGITEPVPVNLARRMGATRVIAVDVMGDYPGRVRQLRLREKLDQQKVDTASVAQAAYGLLLTQFDEARLTIQDPDIVIRPQTGHMNAVDFLKVEELVQEGEAAATDALAALRAIAAA